MSQLFPEDLFPKKKESFYEAGKRSASAIIKRFQIDGKAKAEDTKKDDDSSKQTSGDSCQNGQGCGCNCQGQSGNDDAQNQSH